MQVSFTGMKNVGFMNITSPNTDDRAAVLNMQLTDDNNGKELSEFKKLIKVPGFYEKYKNEYNKDFVNIFATYEESEFGAQNLNFYLNGSLLKPVRNTMPLYTFLAKITRNFANKPEEKCVVNLDYLSSDDARYGIYPGMDLNNACAPDEYDYMMQTIHSPQKAKRGAQIMNNLIQEKMIDYLA